MVGDLTTRGPRVDLERVVHSVFALSLSLSVHASFFEISWLPPTAHRLRIRWIRESKFPTGKNGSVCVYLSICVSSVIDWQHVEGFPCLL